MADTIRPISLRQARALIEAKTGIPVKLHRLRSLAEKMVKDGWLVGSVLERDEIRPDDLDQLVGEVERSVTGWYQKRNVRGDFLGWVLRLGDTEPVLLALPYERTYDPHAKTEDERMPDMVQCCEWPTARLTGVLVRQAEDRNGYPYYVYQPRESESE